MEEKRHDPCGNRCDKDDDDRISKPFQTGTHIQLGKVDAACNKWKSGDDKQHGTDITGLVLQRNREKVFRQIQCTNINQTGCGNR